MTIKDLEQFNSLISEIKQLKERIDEMEEALNNCGDKEFSFVQGSSPNSPYIKHSIAVAGYIGETREERDRINLIITGIHIKIREKECELVNELSNINTFIYSINDSEVRQILILRFIDGYTWLQIANNLSRKDGLIHTESYARHKIDRFLKEGINNAISIMSTMQEQN